VPILESPQTFAKIVKNPINTNSPGRFQNLGILLKTICLRRTRELLDLPEPVPRIRRIPLTPSERVDYDSLLHRGQIQIDMAVSGRRKGRVNSTVLEALLKLRLFCNNGKDLDDLHSSTLGLPEDPDEALSYLQQQDQNICAYCKGTIYSLSQCVDDESGSIIGKCAHLLCQTCLPQHRAQKRECPTCAEDIMQGFATMDKPVSETPSQGVEKDREQRRYPSKLLALLSDLQKDLGNKRFVCHFRDMVYGD
jgi:SNF2 family DNA or RNA helicase